jgi:mitogen-activated protein kinase 15
MESDLHAVIKAGILQEVHKNYVVYQLVRALKYMHSGELIHRDIKPSNVLLKSDCSIKLCDFGLARSIAPSIGSHPDANPVMTDYVATRWYRAPELLLGSPHYTKGVDIWAVGCILAEMIVGKPVFPGTSTLDQLERVVAITGAPSAEDLAALNSSFAATMLDSIRVSKKPLTEMFPRATTTMLHFMQRCFEFNPLKRATAEELLNHPLLAQFHDPKWEPDAKGIIRIPLDDNVKLTASDYRKRLYDIIVQKKKEINH